MSQEHDAATALKSQRADGLTTISRPPQTLSLNLSPSRVAWTPDRSTTLRGDSLSPLFHLQEGQPMSQELLDMSNDALAHCSDDDQDDDDDLPVPPPIRVPKALVEARDIIYDASVGEYVTSPKKLRVRSAQPLMQTLSSNGSVTASPSRNHRQSSRALSVSPTTGLPEVQRTTSRRVSLSNLMPESEHVLQTLCEKRPDQRTDKDIEIIHRHIDNLPPFSFLSSSTKRKLARVLHLKEFYSKDSTVCEPEKRNKYWWAVYTGGVVIQSTEQSDALLSEGDTFGYRCPRPQESDHVTTAYLHTQLWRVEASDYDEAMSASNPTKEYRKDGRVVLVTEQRSVDQESDRQDGTAGSTAKQPSKLRSVIVRGTKERLVQALFDRTDKYGVHQDPNYIRDFLTTFRSFCSPQELLDAIEDALYDANKRPHALEVLVFWARDFYRDFEESESLFTQLVAVDDTIKGLARKDPHAKDLIQALAALKRARSAHASPREVHLTRRTEEWDLGFMAESGRSSTSTGVFITQITPASPAEHAKLKVGDELLEINGRPVRETPLARVEEMLYRAAHLKLLVRHNMSAFQRFSRNVSSARSISPSTLGVPSPTPEDSAVAELDETIGTSGRTSLNNSVGRRRGALMRKIFRGSTSGDKASSTDQLTSQAAAISRLQNEFNSALHDAIKVFRADQTFRYVAVEANTRAAEVVEWLCHSWYPGEDSSLFILCEVTITDQSDVKVTALNPNAKALATSCHAYGRYYIKRQGVYENLVPDEAAKTMRASRSENVLLTAEPSEIALQLCQSDLGHYVAIDPTDYVDYLMCHRKDQPHVAAMTERFNWICDWVKTEVLSVASLKRRAEVIKQFIKIARACKLLNNFNSLFAIVSGLASAPVSRLKLTWDRLTTKYIEEYEDLEALMDPTRNMGSYRAALSAAKSQLPVVPFFPLIMKDIAFMHEGNPTNVEGMINFDKMRLISRMLNQEKRVNEESQACAASWGQALQVGFVPGRSIKAAFQRRKQCNRINAYFAEVDVVRDAKEHAEASQKCEPSLLRRPTSLDMSSGSPGSPAKMNTATSDERLSSPISRNAAKRKSMSALSAKAKSIEEHEYGFQNQPNATATVSIRTGSVETHVEELEHITPEQLAAIELEMSRDASPPAPVSIDEAEDFLGLDISSLLVDQVNEAEAADGAVPPVVDGAEAGSESDEDALHLALSQLEELSKDEQEA